MSDYGTILLARSDRLLVDLREVRVAFGTGWERLLRRSDGWQLLEVHPHPHQWPGVGAGPGPLAMATGAPVLAVWVSQPSVRSGAVAGWLDGESACGQFAAAMPDGSVWSGHYPDCKGAYDHHAMSPLRLPPGVESPQTSLGELTSALSAWSGAAGLPVSASEIGRAITERSFAQLAEALAGLFGFAAGAVEVPRLFEHRELEWMEVWYRGWRAATEICGEWSWQMTGLERSTEPFEPSEAETELIRFLDRVADSIYGGGLSRAELAAEAARLETTFFTS
jgi:hypothetical protein